MKNRETMNFNTGWLYLPADCANGHQSGFDDGGFERVSLPHANTVLDRHKGDDFLAQIEKYRFVSWYRRHFTLPERFREKRLKVEFEGVATVAEAFLNGVRLGEHKGAYTGFSFDITDFVNFEGENVLAVRVDSTRRADIPPEGGEVDYCLFGGIVRNVRLRATEPAYVDDAFLTAPALDAESGRVRCAVSVRNASERKKALKVEAVIRGADGSTAVRAVSDEKTVPAGEAADFGFDTPEIKKPHLWSVDAPYLYTAEVSVIENGESVDSYETKIGLRRIEFTETGFYLNGERLVLRGVNRHEQWPWQGRAVPDKLQARDADLIKDTGFNAVRCSHYPQAPAFLRRCDELGLIVFEEAPGWQYIGDAAWKEIYKTNVREMILRDRNHPSVVTWGVRVNEAWDDRNFVAACRTVAKELDPTRPTHGVRRNENYDSTEMVEDIFCNNYIYPEAPRLRPFVSTEHSWEHWTDGCGLPSASGARAAEFTKSFADVVDYYYRCELCLGGFAWSMFDYNNEVNYTRTGHVFYSGIYDIFRLDKPVAHFYRAQKEPSAGAELYIADCREEGGASVVEVYGNCDEVGLFAGGRGVGRQGPNLYMNVPHPAFRFADVPSGSLTAVGYIAGREVSRADCPVPEKAAKISVAADYASLVADGADMTCVTVTLTDKNGVRLPRAADEVTIRTEGPAVFIGESPIALEGGRTGFMLRSRFGETGTVKCTVTARGVEAGSCEINVTDYDGAGSVPCAEQR